MWQRVLKQQSRKNKDKTEQGVKLISHATIYIWFDEVEAFLTRQMFDEVDQQKPETWGDICDLGHHCLGQDKLEHPGTAQGS